MHLKSIEIVGFKSFADKTRIELKPGITGVVGPNGCGKSNVMEAIRWCIGEMSWKSLRSPSMVDIIFAGNSRRNATGLAEVTLTFDNSSRQLSVDYSEITITRRIFRSGESEYLLNKTPCRLKDIRELFLDTGIGGDGYAVIDQGGVDFILNSKPEDRRSLFEEAAGVAKYRAKREEALRKLERVEADLARLQDSIVLISDQIKKLDSDARKAKLYQKYKDELLSMEVGQIVAEIGTISGELEKESSAMAPVVERLKNRQMELDAEEGRLAALKLEWTEQQAQVAELNQKAAEFKSEISRLEERIKNSEVMESDSQKRKISAQEQLSRDEMRLTGMDPEMDQVRAAVEHAEQMRVSAQKELDEFEEQMSGMERDIQKVTAQAQETESQVLFVAQAAMSTSNTLSKHQSGLGDTVFHVRQTLKELAKAAAQTESGKAEIESQLAEIFRQQSWVSSCRKVLDGLEAKRETLKTDLSNVSEEMFKARTELASTHARMEALEMQGGQDPYWVGAQAAAAADIPGVLGTLRSLIDVEKGFESYFEDALGERLYAVVCEDSSSALKGIEYLENVQKGRARFLVLSSLGDSSSPIHLPPNAKSLLDHVRCDPRVQKAMGALIGECYSLDRCLYGKHWVCGGSPDSEAVAMKLSDVGSLRESIAGIETLQSNLAQRKSAIDAEIASVEENIRSSAAAYQEELSLLNVLQAHRKQKEDHLQYVLNEVEISTQESIRLLAEIAGAKEEIQATHKALAEIRSQENALRKTAEEVSQGLQTLKTEALSRRARQEGLQNGLKQWETQHSYLQGQSNRLAVEHEALKNSIERHRAEILEIDNRLAELAQVKVESTAQMGEHHRQLAEYEISSQSMTSRLAELTHGMQEMEKSIHEMKADCQSCQEELHQWEVRASAIRSRMDSLKGRLTDEWQLSFEDAAAKYEKVEIDVEKIQTLRRRIQNMGNINLAAPEEYEELSQKHQFLLAQVADLNKAKEDLRSAITKINATTREHFRQTFTEVREHFRRIYGTLFEGGEADLVLTDQENLLETGIDIVAQPPGKRLQSITLLSGGERTLTAIALLFAFFMVKPSPICMLDEADAALDEANVQRFAAMLKEFSEKSQFLIISHNKRTMEAADMIYGVTMEESGVSQIISVDFRRKSNSDAPSVESLIEQDAKGSQDPVS